MVCCFLIVAYLTFSIAIVFTATPCHSWHPAPDATLLLKETIATIRNYHHSHHSTTYFYWCFLLGSASFKDYGNPPLLLCQPVSEYYGCIDYYNTNDGSSCGMSASFVSSTFTKSQYLIIHLYYLQKFSRIILSR
jgi:hypothetical protein